MTTLVYKLKLSGPFTLFKSGEFIGEPGWRHDLTNNKNGDYEIMVVTKGTIYLDIDHTKFAVQEGDCILVPPFVTHFGFKATETTTKHYWIHFLLNTNHIEKYNNSGRCARQHYNEIFLPQLFKISEINKIIVLAKQLLDSAEIPNNLLQCNYLLTALLIELSNQYLKNATQQKTDKSSQRMEQICNWIKLHAYENITVAQVADKFNISSVYLTRLFQKYQQQSTLDYIHNEKITLAQELLLTTSKSVKEISYQLGFTNDKYFMRLFKKLTNMTPTQYRNTYTKEYVNNNTRNPDIPFTQKLNHLDEI